MQDDTLFACRVSAFGNLRVEAYLQLTAAYRSLSRPSSAPDAKASSLRPLSLDLSVKLENYASHFGFYEIVSLPISNLDVPQFLLSSSMLCLRFIESSLFSFQGAESTVVLRGNTL